ncbi:hypothetical protein H4R34_005443 [Dimargaris verticillata]|uniref:O-acyltransferase n=1 Tax=Dimargaris verticillata TaxID=2761393 RepID=A0A9W8AWH5_9FUNG|nr:hypothetical protein H4R34_005443 [Dimargaris verticillata]
MVSNSDDKAAPTLGPSGKGGPETATTSTTELRQRAPERSKPLAPLNDAEITSEYSEREVSTSTVAFALTTDRTKNHVLPVHTAVQSSILSYQSGKVSYKGFLNLALLLLFVTNVRLVVENYIKYGFLISIPGQYVPPQDWVFAVVAFSLLPVNIVLAFAIEWLVSCWLVLPLLSTRGHSETTQAPRPSLVNAQVDGQSRGWAVGIGLAHALNLCIMLLFPSYVVYHHMYHPLLGLWIVFTVVIQFLKLLSYTLTNQYLRYQCIHGLPQPLEYTTQYPANITLRNLLYFSLTPTLCYQPSYPRSARFRKRFFLKRCLEGLIAIVMIYFLVEQYAIPTLKNSVAAMDQLHVIQIMERVFKLSTTSVMIWLLGFYAFFHAFLNALAEALYFGDRSFYLPWWNSGTVARYWRLWNQPVHYFFKRHIYLPCIRAGLPPMAAIVLIFFVSALLHELVIAIPTHNTAGHAFWGLFLQVPLILLTNQLAAYTGKDSSTGNVVFWVTFCILGQPFLVVRYFYDWTKQNIVAMP